MRNGVFLVLICLVLPVSAWAADQQVERGRYLVEHVGLCADCHSPRDQKGQFIRSEWLKGAAIGFKPLGEMPWADYAPRIAGIPLHYNEAQLIEFLQTGRRPDGSSPRPPMPPYRLNQRDSEAVTAYLKALQ